MNRHPGRDMSAIYPNNMGRTYSLVFIINSLLLLYFVIAGCDETFLPLEENDQYHFTIYGFLDASADTQWVRVMPVRENLYPGRDPIDAIVTLEHVESGSSVVMNDSLFGYFHDRYAWNFWTTWELHPEQTYRLTAERSDGKSSYAEVSLPKDFPIPVVETDDPQFGTSARVYFNDIEHLADVRVIHYLRFHHTDQEYIVPFGHLQQPFLQESGEYMIFINPSKDRETIGSLIGDNPHTTYPMQIFIASAGPEFRHFPMIDQREAVIPERISNITNGIGYLAGIVSKTIPYEMCLEEGTGIPAPCEPEPYPWSLNIQIWHIDSSSP